MTTLNPSNLRNLRLYLFGCTTVQPYIHSDINIIIGRDLSHVIGGRDLSHIIGGRDLSHIIWRTRLIASLLSISALSAVCNFMESARRV